MKLLLLSLVLLYVQLPSSFGGIYDYKQIVPPTVVILTTKAPVATKVPTSKYVSVTTKAPTKTPTKAPTNAPTQAPTNASTKSPYKNTTKAQTYTSTKAPTKTPTKAPTNPPTTPNPTEFPNEDCKENEVFSECDNHGCQNTCADPDLLPRCSYVAGCYPGCICNPGYLRNSDGICVLEESCVNRCPSANETYNQCGTACPRTCSNKDEIALICSRNCVPGCFCVEGYVRDDNGVCILPANCVNRCPSANEIYNQCGTACPRTCSNKDETALICTKNCVQGCFCKEGYVRDDNGVCILPANCVNRCPSANEIYNQCGTACPRTCSNKDETALICTKNCVQGCFCKEGYVRDDNGVCILPANCVNRCPSANEIYNQCGTACPRTCSNKDETALICTKNCVQGCFCKEGYVRDDNGVCILPANCVNRCPSANEIYNQCGTACPRTCSNKDETALICTKNCVQGCFCKEGYVRDDNGVCILPANCVNRCPSANEIYNQCGTACPRTCSNKDETALICTKNCVQGCFCKEGYVRDDNGVCILPANCVNRCPSANEIYNQCGTACPRTCSNKDETALICTKNCVQGCFCKEGYVRDDKGVCILPANCVNRCPSANEIYNQCGTACPRTCSNKDETALICTKNCVQGCFCKEGYVRDDNGVCILPANCVNRCPSANEIYNQCGTACPRTCSNKDETALICTKNCVQGCFCKEGYVRDDNGVCILPANCVNRCPSANEIYNQCGTACPRTCSNKDETALICTKNCVQGCFCKEGYVRDDKGVCILPANCAAPVCGANQVFDKCPPISPAEGACVNVFKATTPEHPSPCKAGCKCKTGFVRIGKHCVVEGKCCTDPNAELVKNPPCCGGGTCAKPYWITGCGKKSDPKGCQCKKGYCKNSETDVTCIAVNDCKKSIGSKYTL